MAVSDDVVDIRRALEKHLDALSLLPDIAWENVRYQPSIGTPFIRPTVIWGQMRPASAGITAPFLYLGIFQIDIFTPISVGTSVAEGYAGDLREHFRVGLDLTENGKVLGIRYCEQLQGVSESDWYHLPVSVSWYSYIPQS